MDLQSKILFLKTLIEEAAEEASVKPHHIFLAKISVGSNNFSVSITYNGKTIYENSDKIQLPEAYVSLKRICKLFIGNEMFYRSTMIKDNESKITITKNEKK